MKNPHASLHNVILTTARLFHNISPLETGHRARIRSNLLRSHIEAIRAHHETHHRGTSLDQRA